MTCKGYHRLVNTSLNFLFDQLKYDTVEGPDLELVSKELNHLAAILHVYAGSLKFMK